MKITPITLGLLLAIATATPLRAQVSAFTYQGRLNLNGTPANGSYDFMFRLLNDPNNGVAAPVIPINLAVPVTNGLFTTGMGFGAENFNGANRWLEINVRTNGGGPFTTLSPRQLLTPTPYAIAAHTTSNLLGALPASQISGTIPPSNIGAGTIAGNMLAPGAAAANLAASGQGGVPSGGMVVSSTDNDPNLTGSGYLRYGGYVSAPNLWRQRASNPSLAPRQGHAAVWTGNKMIVWGGYCGNENPNVPPPITYFSDGGCYSPNADSWSPISTNGAPLSRKSFSTVWTGSEMVIWSGHTFDTVYNFFNDGARYDPASNSWATISTNNVPLPRSHHTAVWTGTEMIVWGGFFATGAGFQYFAYRDGARYNPTTDTWTPVTTNGAPSARFYHTAVWTGSEMIVWGGQNGNGIGFNDGKRYNPTSDTWSPMSSTNAFPGRFRHTVVWTGSEMIIWGGFSGGGPYEQSGGRYNPATDRWSETEYSLAPTGRTKHTAVWTGREMVIWGGECANPVPHCNDGGSYDPISNMWTPLTVAPRAPAWRVGHTAVWTGSEMVVCYGGDDAGNCLSDIWSCSPPKLLYLYLKQ